MRKFSLPFRKPPLQSPQMVTAEVLHAKALSSELLRWESRGPGDTENAMRRVARRHGIDYGALWSLRYRAPKRIWADVANAISAAYDAEVERQREKLKHAAITAEQTLGANHPSVRRAQALVRRTARAPAPLVDAKRKRLIPLEDRV